MKYGTRRLIKLISTWEFAQLALTKMKIKSVFVLMCHVKGFDPKSFKISKFCLAACWSLFVKQMQKLEWLKWVVILSLGNSEVFFEKLFGNRISQTRVFN